MLQRNIFEDVHVFTPVTETTRTNAIHIFAANETLGLLISPSLHLSTQTKEVKNDSRK